MPPQRGWHDVDDENLFRQDDRHDLQFQPTVVLTDPCPSLSSLLVGRTNDGFAGVHDVEDTSVPNPVPARGLGEPDPHRHIMAHTIVGGLSGYIYVLPVSAELTFDGDLACDWRDGDVW